MNEPARISGLFEKFYNGDPCLGINIESTLEAISHEKAASRMLPDCNSIWEITKHMIEWRKNYLKRLQGEIVVTPASNYILEIRDTSEEAWQSTLEDFARTNRDWIQFLNQFEESQFEKVYPPNNKTYYEHLHAVLQHDAYHLGQIVFLNKYG